MPPPLPLPKKKKKKKDKKTTTTKKNEKKTTTAHTQKKKNSNKKQQQIKTKNKQTNKQKNHTRSNRPKNIIRLLQFNQRYNQPMQNHAPHPSLPLESDISHTEKRHPKIKPHTARSHIISNYTSLL